MQSKTKVDELREMMEKKIAAEADAPGEDAAALDPAAVLQERVDAAEAQAREHHEQMLRTLAEFENFRKRTERDKADAIAFANNRLLEELMPILDHLEMALASVGGDAKFAEGIELTFKQFLTTLAKFGFAEVPATRGAPFDPSLHEAITQIDAEDCPSNTIVTVHRRGYSLNNRVLRPALVEVAK